MPIYMDLHIIPGVTANDVAEAHRLDVLIQEDHHCKCMTYWIDESRGQIFCLIEAPDKEVVVELHNKAHGLVPHKIIEVQTSLVESFLGRISDPENVELNSNGLKLLNDPGFRILVVIKLGDQVLQQCYHGEEKATELLNRKLGIIREELARHGGHEAEHEGPGLIASFTSANEALACASSIQQQFKDLSPGDAGFRIGINAGEPVTGNSKLFGDTIQLAERICFIADDHQVGLSSSVKELLSNNIQRKQKNIFSLTVQDEQFLSLLFSALDKNWQDPDFNVEDYCQTMAMSKSQLYRKTVSLTGFSPNVLLKEYRLEKARELMKKKPGNISQVTFDTGFASPSYFTKCFKKKYGILPMAYQEVLH